MRGWFEGLKLEGTARETYRHHRSFALLDAASKGILANATLMAVKALHATDAQMGLHVSIAGLGMLLALGTGSWMQGRAKLPFMTVPGLAAAACVLGMALPLSTFAFVVLLGISELADFSNRPAVAAIVRLNYPPELRGSVTGALQQIGTAVQLVFTLVSALLLDRFTNEGLARAQLAVAGALMAAAYFAFGRIQVAELDTELASPALSLEPIARTLRVSFRDAPFRRYLRGFFIYGIGYLMLLPLIPGLLTRQLKYGYTAATLLMTVIPAVASAISSREIGRWFDRVNLCFAWAAVRVGWAVDVFLLAAAATFPALATPLVVTGRLTHGTFAGASLILGYQLGVNPFAKKEDTSAYMGVQIGLNGVERLLAPSLGAWLVTHYNTAVALCVGGTLMLLGALHAYEQGRDQVRAAREEAIPANA